MKKNITRDLQINRDYALGITKSELARRWNVSREYIGQIIAKYNDGDRSPAGVLTPDIMMLIKELRTMYGVSLTDIAKVSGQSTASVRSHLYQSQKFTDATKMKTVQALHDVIMGKLNRHNIILKQLTSRAE